jgi:flagellar hook-associated protein 1 FlgK
MSISATLSNALTGLTAASRGAQIVSSNVANANTEGYARREIELSPRLVGGVGAGVQVDGINRIVDNTVLRERRLAEAAVGNNDVLTGFYEDLLNLTGTPDDGSSLSAAFVDLETSFLEASFRPDSETRLYSVLNAAEALTRKINGVSDGIQKLRQDADEAIASQVAILNQSLVQIADLNAEILRAKGSNLDYPALLDQRQRLVDEISQIVPIRELPRDNDTIALYTLTGGLLLDAKPAQFSFEATAPITPDMTLTSGALSVLQVNGQNMSTSGAFSPIAGGSLAGLFTLRDELAVEAQTNIDEVARSLAARFESPTLDTTLLVGEPGLFTDSGSPLNPTDQVGLAGRLSVNSLVDPAVGGAVWRLRDGLGAATPGPTGNPTLLNGSLAALEALEPPVAGSFGVASRSASEFASSLISQIGRAQQASENRLSFERARLTGLQDAERRDGVDTDQELQKLLLIEQAYAANARVVQAADELLQALLRI